MTVNVKKNVCILLTLILLILCLPQCLAYYEETWVNPYSDVTEDRWYYECITSLNKNNIAPDSEVFGCDLPETRVELMRYLFRLYLCLGGKWESSPDCQFKDVYYENYDYNVYDVVQWAYENGIASGVGDDRFDPDAHITREQVCTFVMRYAEKFDAKFRQYFGTEQFVDSLNISDYARSYVTACKMAGIISGYEDGYFYPKNDITRAETASIVYSLMNASVIKPDEGEAVVSTAADAYTYLYDSYVDVPKPFVALVPESDPVDLSYFDDAVLIGDSVTLSLQYYCASSKGLGNVTFLSSGSLSPVNALWEVSSASVHPSYQGTKMKVEDGVARCGAKKVYIMLGINSISMGIDLTVSSMMTLIDKILEKSPDVQIIIESVTPMTSTSNIITGNLNNSRINEYNSRMSSICQEKGWYYLNVAEAFRDENGNLISSYCSDGKAMGIHFTYDADAIWVDYLKTHVPEDLK